MSTKNHRSGGKFSGRHTTVIPAAGIVADLAIAQGEVTKVSLGFIKTGLPSANGKRRVKLTQEQGDILLSIRDNTSHQEIRVYTPDIQKTMQAIAREAKNKGFLIKTEREL